MADPVIQSAGPSGSNPGGSNPLKIIVPILLIAIVLFGGWWYIHNRSSSSGGGGKSGGTGPDTSHSHPLADLHIHGSNTIGSALVPALVKEFLKSQGATDIETRPLGKEESDIVGTLPGASKPLVIEIFAHGSATAFQGLLDKTADIGMASRPVNPANPDEARAIREMDLLSAGGEHVVGKDGIAIIVNRNNSTVSELTVDQLSKIFSCEVTNWSDVGGAPGPISVFSRDDKSGTWETLKSRVLKTKPLCSNAVRLEDSTELSNRVAADPTAIGFIGLPYILNAKAIAVSETEKAGGSGVKATTPLYPNRLTVQTEDYPLSRRLYLYTPANSTNTWSQKFVDFALSKAGQDVVGQNGFVSQTPVVAEKKDEECTACPARYRDLVSGRHRLSTDFRFNLGQSTLETLALIDVGRTADVLADLKYSGHGVALIGFCDSVGCPPGSAACLRLSKERAKTVADEFIKHGVTPDVVDGMGSEMPVASNDSPEGQKKNRRVEIWISQ